jgi:hypothetical protein
VKNIPHQINDLTKLHKGLEVFGHLDAVGVDLTEDRSVGRELAKAGVYTFRDKTIDLETSFRLEDVKPSSRQGTRTVARDLRRLFELLGFLQRDSAGRPHLTPLARLLLQIEPNSDEAVRIWRSALHGLSLMGKDGTESHPYSIMIRLAKSHPGLPPKKLALALEAEDDSEEEFERISVLASSDDWVSELQEKGVSLHMIRNGAKVLPAIARQLTDLSEAGGVVYAGPEATRKLGEPRSRSAGFAPQGVRRRQHRTVSADSIATAPTARERAADEEYFVDPEVTREAALERLSRHNAIVRTIATILGDHELREDPYDTLASKQSAPSLLIEVKTLRSDSSDETARVRGAVAQLLYYARFDIPADVAKAGLVRVAVFERRISEDHVTFMESLEIAVIWLEGDFLYATELSKRLLGNSPFADHINVVRA